MESSSDIHKIWATFTFIFFVVICFFAVAKSTLTKIVFEEACQEECHPYSYDILDEDTCSCWLPNGKIELREVDIYQKD